jgi:hypothetical protein
MGHRNIEDIPVLGAVQINESSAEFEARSQRMNEGLNAFVSSLSGSERASLAIAQGPTGMLKAIFSFDPKKIISALRLINDSAPPKSSEPEGPATHNLPRDLGKKQNALG